MSSVLEKKMLNVCKRNSQSNFKKIEKKNLYLFQSKERLELPMKSMKNVSLKNKPSKSIFVEHCFTIPVLLYVSLK